ncbi:hypothetical protein HN858_03550 [Candidatus Falkowbacteria bacterium]|jgi:hypothetical protein|nr:hypothetical protein [Candidatus Falkowbacteria bacterium]MBT5503053.1 hypothetical protein [Candidatus Falkowbacteria bacterium]MBT6574128.1 hypothetical protein [Candidatus Falkowbacteria bacterium]MBT7348725.1 hypothetical protein [Candidatus Falkowbacteria bacterium]MBT7500515.1 hypothetical protein [Candidatus Falkowbacteria bacterium]
MIELDPTLIKPRYACPFFGFARSGGRLVVKHGDCCCLQNGRVCTLKITGRKPDWEDCGSNCNENFEKVASLARFCRIFPSEFAPQQVDDRKNWTGISLKVWVEYVMGENVPRP